MCRTRTEPFSSGDAMNAIIDKPALTLSSAQTRRRPRRRPFRWLLRTAALLLLLVGAAATANWWLVEGRFIESTDDAYVQGDIAVLGPRIEGDVIGVQVADNQRVHAGDPLILLDPQDWQARLDQARAAEAETAAAVLVATRQITQQQAMVDAAQASIVQAQAQQKLAGADAERSSELAKAGWASRQADDRAITDRLKADAALVSAQAQKAAAEQLLAVDGAQLVQARARHQSAVAALHLAENNLSYTVIRAPFGGVVGNRSAQPGQHVQTGAQLIAVSPLPDRLYVTANFKETQLAHVRPGMKVQLSADIDPAHPIEGRVDSLAPATGALFSLLPPENATGNFTRVVQRVPVKVALDPDQADASSWLRAGLSVTASVDTRGPQAQQLGLFGVAAATWHRITQ
jgi:membrane fusion protein (multidrug efflux system)